MERAAGLGGCRNYARPVGREWSPEGSGAAGLQYPDTPEVLAEVHWRLSVTLVTLKESQGDVAQYVLSRGRQVVCSFVRERLLT